MGDDERQNGHRSRHQAFGSWWNARECAFDSSRLRTTAERFGAGRRDF
jgi:hypothetical protein